MTEGQLQSRQEKYSTLGTMTFGGQLNVEATGPHPFTVAGRVENPTVVMNGMPAANGVSSASNKRDDAKPKRKPKP
jgi:hypothetical protein